jgi:hypothetical protein
MPLTYRSPTREAGSEVCFSWATNPPSRTQLVAQSSMSLPSSKTWWHPQPSQKLTHAFTKPKAAPAQSYTNRVGPHTQSPTPLQTDNSTAFGMLNETIKQKRSKAMDIRYHWLADRVRQKQFDVYWRPGCENLGDYHTKHHSAQHDKDMRHFILLNYSHSRNPTCAPARTHGRTQAPREPPN